MVQRQPAHHRIGGPHLYRESDSANIREHVCVGQRHALGIPRAARRVLDEADLGWLYFRRPGVPAAIREGTGAEGLPKRRQLPAQDARDSVHPVERDQEAHLRVLQDAALALDVSLQLIRPGRGVDRDCDPAGQHDAEEAGEEVFTGGQHDRDGLAASQPGGRQARRDSRRARVELPVRDILAAVLIEQVDMDPGRVPLCLSAQHFGDAPGGVRSGVRLPARLNDRPAAARGAAPIGL